MRLYVKHCPVACPGRRELLEEHLKNRGFTDVVWVTGYPATHPFVQWLCKRLGTKMEPSHVSGLVKSMEAFQMFVDDPTTNIAMFCDDDAVFIKDWKEKLRIPVGIPFLNASVGVNFHIYPDGKLHKLANNGGCEVTVMTKDFARILLNNVDVRVGGDHVIFGMLMYLGIPLLCSPIAQQTSILEPKKPSVETITFNEVKNLIINFKPTGLKYSSLWDESGYSREGN